MRQAVAHMTYIRMGEDKFTETGVECVSVHAVPRREDQVCRGTVPGDQTKREQHGPG